MKTSVLNQIEALRRATLVELRERYREAFGEETRSRHREHLFRKIAWRLQAQEQGGLGDRARARAQEIASDTDLRILAPRGFFGPDSTAKLTLPRVDRGAQKRDPRLPLAGATIEREFRGRRHFVEVLPDGFRYQGRQHKSLSSIAREITGTRWNGLAFFGLTGEVRSKPAPAQAARVNRES